MSTDYKIGIVVGLLVLILGVTYFLMSGSEEPAPQPQLSQEEKEPNEPVLGEGTDPGTPVADEGQKLDSDTGPGENLPASPPSGEQPPDTAKQAMDTEKEPVVGWNLDEDADSEVSEEVLAISEPTETEEPVLPKITDADEDDGFKVNVDADSVLKEPDPVITTVKEPQQVNLDGKTMYTVRKGDLGFWYIAVKVYGEGNGKFWTHIRDANPGADSNALRPGQVLTIPPLPVRTMVGREPPAAPKNYGRTISDPAGQKIYVVGKSEPAGLWGIAARPEVYGKGHYWQHIQKANPVAAKDPTRLKPGTRLIIPPLPQKISTVPSPARDSSQRSIADHGRTIVQDGRRYYIVQAGDAGYWGVAKRVYGNGKYEYLVDRANPGVDTNSLQPGDKLYVPPRPPDTPRSQRRTETPAPTRSARPVPDFGP